MADIVEQTLPVVDVGPALGDDPTGVETVAASLDEAYRRIGFCYLTGHGIAEGLLDDVFAASSEFHALPLEDKRALTLNRWHRGFIEIDTSVIRSSTVDTVRQPNQSESLMVMHELAPDHPDRLRGAPLAGPNQWPDNLPGFRERVLAYDAAMADLCRRLVRTIAVALGEPIDRFDSAFAEPITFLRLLRYPPHRADAPADMFGAAPHSDYGFITVLAQHELSGLEVRRPDQTWVPAPVIDNAFVMNCGDILHRWSNGRWLSTPHRVINGHDRFRYSAPYFFDPHPSVVVEPLAGSVEDGVAPKYEPVVYGDYLMSRLEKNYSQHQQDEPSRP